MAEEPYIKMRKKLRTDPRVTSLATKLQQALSGRPLPLEFFRAVAIGGLFKLWCLGDEHGEVLRELTKPLLDEDVGIPGFCDALPPEWLQERVTSKKSGVTTALHLPNYVGHNSTTERTRALGRERVRKHREKKKAQGNGVTALHDPPDQTRPDQRRVEENKPPTTDDLHATCGYAREVCGFDFRLVGGQELLLDFGLAVVVAGLEHLASRRPSARLKGIKNPHGFMRDLMKQFEAEEGPELQGNSFEPFENWRVRRESEVASAGRRP